MTDKINVKQKANIIPKGSFMENMIVKEGKSASHKSDVKVKKVPVIIDKEALYINHYYKAALLKDPMSGNIIPQSFNKFLVRFRNFIETPLEDYEIFPLDPLGDIIKLTLKPLESILKKPRFVYVKESVYSPSYKVKQVDMGRINKIIETAPGRTVKEKLRYSDKLPSVETFKKYDLMENRAVKYFVKILISHLEKRVEQATAFSKELADKEDKNLDKLKRLYKLSPVKGVTIDRALSPNNILLFDKNYMRIWKGISRFHDLEKDNEKIKEDKEKHLRQLLIFSLMSRLSCGNYFWNEMVLEGRSNDKAELKGVSNIKIASSDRAIKISVKDTSIVLKVNNEQSFTFKFHDNEGFSEQIIRFADKIKKTMFPDYKALILNNQKEKGLGNTIGVIPYSLSPRYVAYDGESKVSQGKMEHQIVYEKESVDLKPGLPYLVSEKEYKKTTWIDALCKGDDEESNMPINFISRLKDMTQTPENIYYAFPDGISESSRQSILGVSNRYFKNVKTVSHSVAAVLWYGLKNKIHQQVEVCVYDFLSPVPTVSKFVAVTQTKKDQPLYWRRLYTRPLEESGEDEGFEPIPGVIDVIDEISDDNKSIYNKLTGSVINTNNFFNQYEKLIKKHNQIERNKSIKLVIDNSKEKYPFSQKISKEILLEGLKEFIEREKKGLISYKELYPEIKLIGKSDRFQMIEYSSEDTFKPEWGKEDLLKEFNVQIKEAGDIYIPAFINSVGSQKEITAVALLKNLSPGNGKIQLLYKLGSINPYLVNFISEPSFKRETAFQIDAKKYFNKSLNFSFLYIKDNDPVYSRDDYNVNDYLEWNFSEMGKKYRWSEVVKKYSLLRNSLVYNLVFKIGFDEFLKQMNNEYKKRNMRYYYSLLHLFSLGVVRYTESLNQNWGELKTDEIKEIINRTCSSIIFQVYTIERFVLEKDNHWLKIRLSGITDHIVLLLNLLSLKAYDYLPLRNDISSSLISSLFKLDSILKKSDEHLITSPHKSDQSEFHEYHYFLFDEDEKDGSNIDPLLSKLIETLGLSDFLNKMIFFEDDDSKKVLCKRKKVIIKKIIRRRLGE